MTLRSVTEGVKMKHRNLFSIIVSILLSNTTFAGQLGINISLPERGGTFVDVVKENHRWSDAGTWASLTADQFDEKGWPICDAIYVLDQRPVAEWSDEIDDPDVYRVDFSGTYKCSFSGQATLVSQGEGSIQNKVYDSATNTTTFEFVVASPPGDNHGLFFIAFTNSKRTADSETGSGITNFRMLRPGYSLNTDQIFIDDLLSALTSADFAAIRFMPFLGSNGSEPDYPAQTEWADRKQTDDASQSGIAEIGKKDGAAWEYVIAMANEVQKDIWINIQLSATTDYVTQLATLLKDSLDNDINIYIESSNEVWNTAPDFSQSLYNQAQASELGIGEHNNHARRTIELAQIFESVFGTGSLNNRIRVMLCSHKPMLKWWVEPMLNYVNTNFGEPKTWLYALACQTYYGGGADAGESVEKILDDCRTSITEQIDESGGTNEAGRVQWIAKAASWQLSGGFCSYEGGPDHGGGSTDNIANRIAAERHADMGEILIYNYDDAFFKLGANLAMQFTLSSSYNRYGCWGLTDDISNLDRNYKYQAARILTGSVDIISTKETKPSDFLLLSNYPNPFNPYTTVHVKLNKQGFMTIRVYNILGELVDVLAEDQPSPAGEQRFIFDGSHLAGGIYFLKAEIKSIDKKQFSRNRKILLVK
jgi:hypothetical protein